MTGLEVRQIRNKLMLNQTQFGKLVGAHIITVSLWERGINKVPAKKWDIIRSLIPSEVEVK